MLDSRVWRVWIRHWALDLDQSVVHGYSQKLCFRFLNSLAASVIYVRLVVSKVWLLHCLAMMLRGAFIFHFKLKNLFNLILLERFKCMYLSRFTVVCSHSSFEGFSTYQSKEENSVYAFSCWFIWYPFLKDVGTTNYLGRKWLAGLSEYNLLRDSRNLLVLLLQ